MKKFKVGWLDTETTGAHPEKHDIVQVAFLIEIDGNIQGTEKFNVQPTNWENIEDSALEVNNLTRNDLRKFDPPEVGFRKITAFLSNYVDKYDSSDKLIPAGQNVGFDIDFLHNFWKKQNDTYFGSYFEWFPLDLLALCRYAAYRSGTAPKNYRLATLAKFYDVPIPENLHDSLADIKLTRRVWNVVNQYITVEPPDMQERLPL